MLQGNVAVAKIKIEEPKSPESDDNE